MRLYKDLLTAAIRPDVEQARHAFEVCRSYSERAGITNRYSETCRKWLQEHPKGAE